MSEIQHFTKLAKSWWDVRGPQRILHKMNNMRMDFINENCSFERPKSCLDIGCGGGLLAESLARKLQVSKVLGIDITPGVLETAKMHMKLDPILEPKLQYEQCEVSELRKSNTEKFDLVTMFEVLEHVDQPLKMLNEALDLLAPGGVLFLSTINRTPLAYFTTIFMAENVLEIVPRGTHTLSKYVNSQEILASLPSSYQVKTESCAYIPGKEWVRSRHGTNWGNYLMAISRT